MENFSVQELDLVKRIAYQAIAAGGNTYADATWNIPDNQAKELHKKLQDYFGGESELDTNVDVIPYTGDEIHFTDGTIWSCTNMGWGDLSEVVFAPMSFEQIKEEGFVQDYFFPETVKPVIIDAFKGGAKLVKGVALSMDWDEEEEDEE